MAGTEVSPDEARRDLFANYPASVVDMLFAAWAAGHDAAFQE
jgi:hypothetical protein